MDNPQAAQDDRPVLERLSEVAGIVSAYHDAFGSWTTAPDPSRRAALAALGLDAATDEAASETLDRLVFAPWDRALPRCIVHRLDGTPISVSMVLPADAAGQARWRLLLEEGSGAAPADGTFLLDSLEVVDEGPEGRRRCRLAIPLAPKPGYHRLRIELADGLGAEAPLLCAPVRCWLPDGADDAQAGPRLWGLSVQVHGLRGRDDWGMGDFAALGALARTVGRQGGAFVGVNPLHALFPARPLHCSPYSPNTRLFLNPLYIAIPQVPEYPECPAALDAGVGLDALRAPGLIDYAGVAARKWPALEALYASFVARHQGRRTARGKAHAAFVEAGGAPLRRFAVFEAIAEAHVDAGWSWRDWPEELQDPAGEAVRAFAAAHEDRVGFHLWCQFEADRQLAQVAETAARSGQAIGLYRDLALGSDPTGADAWIWKDMLVGGLAVGAPPDPLNARGQNWGFPPFHPERLADAGFQPFAEMIRANMRHAGALRMDHVLGLMRLFCIPHGFEGREGIYLRMPFDALVAVLAIESWRNRCLVVGEDLGTVPEGFRDRMTAEGILSYRLFFFERTEDAGMLPPEDYPRLAAVAGSTHDLPTLCGFWNGRDLAWKHDLDLFATQEIKDAESMGRHYDRPRIHEALAAAGLPMTHLDDPFYPPPELVESVYAWLARTPSLLELVQIEDVLGEWEQANLPGTLDEHPNWRRRIAVAAEDLEADGRLPRLAERLAREGRAGAAGADEGGAGGPS